MNNNVQKGNGRSP